MNNVVVDSSVAIKWFIPEEDSERARLLLARQYTMYVPEFFYIETDSILTKKLRKRELESREAERIHDTIRHLPVEKMGLMALRDVAWTLANDYFVSVYDALYVTLAMMLNGRLVTADKRLVRTLETSPLNTFLLPLSYLI